MRTGKAHIQQLIFRRRTAVLAGVLGLLLLIAAAGVTPVSGRTVPPARDFRLVVFAVGDWRGNFETDAAGRGGLAALHTLVRRTRERVRVARGRVLLVHAGDLTGAANRRDFHRKLFPPELNLPRYLGLDAVGFSPNEIEYLNQFAFLPKIKFARAVEFNLGREARRAGPVRPFRIAPGQDYNIMLSAWSERPAPRRRAERLQALRDELKRQSALDLRILLVSGTSFTPDAPDTAEEVFGLTPDQNPYDLLEPGPVPHPLRPFLVVRSSAARNQFEQLESGAHLCRIRGRDVCRVEYTYRDHRLIAVNARFIDLNARDRSGAWIPPDRRLVNVLRKERERTPSLPHGPRGEPPASARATTAHDAR